MNFIFRPAVSHPTFPWLCGNSPFTCLLPLSPASQLPEGSKSCLSHLCQVTGLRALHKHQNDKLKQFNGLMIWELARLRFSRKKSRSLGGVQGRRRWHPTPVLLPGKSHGRRSLVGCSPWGQEESDTAERLPFHFSLSCIGEGNGNPLQCSCLENPRDGGTWWAAVSGVTQSRTRLKRLSSSSRGLFKSLRAAAMPARSTSRCVKSSESVAQAWSGLALTAVRMKSCSF